MKQYRAIINLDYLKRDYENRRSILKRAYGDKYDNSIHLQDAKTPEIIKRVEAGMKPLFIKTGASNYIMAIFDDGYECPLSSAYIKEWEKTFIEEI